MTKLILTILLLSVFVPGIAQKKLQKPIKLQAKTSNHKISFDTPNDVFYFTSIDLISFFEKNTTNSEAAAHYLKNFHKEIEYKTNQTSFSNAGERALYNAIEMHLKDILLSGKACDIVKTGNKLNLFVVKSICSSDSTKTTITEKKGRLILECK